jgi:hypothetical protein
MEKHSEDFGLLIIELGREIMEANRMIEKVLSPSVDGKYALSLCGDARWDEQGELQELFFLVWLCCDGCMLLPTCMGRGSDVEPMHQVY